MAEEHLTTKEKEFYSEVSKAQTVLSGLAAVAFLMLRANETETDYTEKFWEELYEKFPWAPKRDFPLDGRLPQGLQDGLSELIFREAGSAWRCAAQADEIIRSEKRAGKLIWTEKSKREPGPGPKAAAEGGV